MRRILVVANRTLCEQHLLDELYARRQEEPVHVHVLVPATHPPGTWTDAQSHEQAGERLDEMLDILATAAIGADGEVGDASPVLAVDDLLLRGARFDEILVSTLPAGMSRWLAANVVRRIHARTGLPVTHVVAEMARTGA